MLIKIYWLSALFVDRIWSVDPIDVPDVCNSANDPDQSPINIDTHDLLDGDGLCTSKLSWSIDKAHEDFLVEYNCYDFKAIPAEGESGLVRLDGPENTISILKTENTPFDDYDEYCLAQFHFHWGSGDYAGSEHTLDGRRFELEAHFVHYACEFGSFAAAQAYGGQSDVEERTLLVVGVQFEKSDDDNPAFDALLSEGVLAEVNGNCGEYFSIRTTGNVLNDLIPREYGGYYAYKGSLTTPPCSTDVNWVVLKEPSYISERQLKRFRSLVNTSSETGETIMRNWRDLQQNNPNPIYSCDGDGDDNDFEGSCADAGAELGLNCACRRSCSGSDCDEGSALAYDELQCCEEHSVCCCGDQCNKRERPEWECDIDSSSSESSDNPNEW